MNKVEKIKAEIERLKNELSDNKERLSLGEIIAVNNCYNSLIFFINSLEEEPVSNDLEEAATKYARKQLSNPDYPTYNDEYEMECAFEAGAQWQKEQMVAKACDWLADNYSKYIITNGLATIFSATIDFDTIRMIGDFKKAMEE